MVAEPPLPFGANGVSWVRSIKVHKRSEFPSGMRTLLRGSQGSTTGRAQRIVEAVELMDRRFAKAG